MEQLKFENITIENTKVLNYEFDTGHTYLLFSPIEDFLKKLGKECVIDNKKTIIQPKNLDFFIEKYRDYTVEEFLYKYDTYDLGSLLLTFDVEHPKDYTNQTLTRIDAYDKKALNLIYILSTSETNKILFFDTEAFSYHSTYRFCMCASKIIKKLNNTIIIHIEDNKRIISDDVISSIQKFDIYNLSETTFGSRQDFYSFYKGHYSE